MVTTLRRFFWLALLSGAGFAAWAVWSSARKGPAATVPTDAPSRATVFEPIDPTPTADGREPPAAAAPRAFASAASGAAWVAPVDGTCPDGYPIKANDNSGIYHVPGGRFYERTRPERCYRDAAAAEADGYRRSKS